MIPIQNTRTDLPLFSIGGGRETVYPTSVQSVLSSIVSPLDLASMTSAVAVK